MTYFKDLVLGFGSVLLGTPLALMMWAIWKSQREATAVSFSPLGLANHLMGSVGFWILVIVLFSAGFVSSVLLRKRLDPLH